MDESGRHAINDPMSNDGSKPLKTAIEDFEQAVAVEGCSEITLALAISGSVGEVDKAAVVEVAALDSGGSRLDIPGWRTRSDRFGEFVYVTSGTDECPAIRKILVKVPVGAATINFKGHSWNSAIRVDVLDGPIVYRRGGHTPDFRTSTGIGVPWGADVISEALEVPYHAERLRLRFRTLSLSESSKKSPVTISFLGDNDALVMPPSDLAQNPTFGPYVYLDAHDPENDFEVSIPADAREVVVRGIPWGERTVQITELPEIEFVSGQSTGSLSQWVENIDDSSNLIVIDSTAPALGDDTRRLRPNNLAYEFASLGYKVVFIPFGSLQDMTTHINVNLVQVDRRSASLLIEDIALSRRHSQNYYICTSFPSLENVARAEYLRMLGWKVAYEVRDDMEEFNRVGYSKWYHPLLERRMLEVAHKVVTVSAALTAKMKIMGPPGLAVLTIPNGVAQSTLDDSSYLREAERLSKSNSSKTVGYVGHLTPSWFDWPAMLHAAKTLPDVKFEVIGHGLPDDLVLPDNIVYLGAMTHSEIIPLATNWKVGVIPFIATPLTRGVDPNKIYEYFAWGLRVVSAPMGSVSTYPSTKVYRNSEEFAARVRDSVESAMDRGELETISEFARGSSWRNRALEMINVLEA